MVIKPRYESEELKLYRILNRRMELSDEEVQHYWSLEKGYEGELQFDAWLADLPGSENWLILNDLMLECNRSTFQIDSLLLVDETLYFFEVKNYEGDVYIDGNGRWLTLAKKEIKNPLLQLERSESLLRQLLQNHGIKTLIEPYVIFINPHFQLYQAPLGQPIIFPTQLQRFSKKLPKSLIIKDQNIKFAHQLVALHLEESPYKRLPRYTYDNIKKGISCVSCKSLNVNYEMGTLICNNCAYKEEVEAGVLRSVNEFKLLNPDNKITTASIHEWCRIIESKKTIRRILSKHFILVPQGRTSYYAESHFI
ncbi:nuclease-related domain-containing protein [Cytobacillus massiliigabonensis]|uniref:nuclease-related domain-containing protein n=1 Tax=Cytobacillus massiliigabonensis TaxID=1871011 RepID=UPI000C81AE9C|nr:nuclease-related domain-containing protein [Cytobacillus massiliigabonensis]